MKPTIIALTEHTETSMAAKLAKAGIEAPKGERPFIALTPQDACKAPLPTEARRDKRGRVIEQEANARPEQLDRILGMVEY